jgi:hypothetical protein
MKALALPFSIWDLKSHSFWYEQMWFTLPQWLIRALDIAQFLLSSLPQIDIQMIPFVCLYISFHREWKDLQNYWNFLHTYDLSQPEMNWENAQQ